jgi:hypothetical protein
VGWTDLAQDRDEWKAVVNTIMNLRVPSTAGKFFNSRTIGGISSDRRLSAKLVPIFADREHRVVSATDPRGLNLGFLDRSCYFSIQVAPQLSSRG